MQNDADYLVVRNKYDEEPEKAWNDHKFGGNTSFNEAKMWSDYVALFGGIKISSDNLLTLRDERKLLIKNAFKIKTANRFIPIDMWNHAHNDSDAFNVILAENDDGVYLSLFNWNDTNKTFTLNGFSKAKLVDPLTQNGYLVDKGKLTIPLEAHSSQIIEIKEESFNEVMKTLKVKLSS